MIEKFLEGNKRFIAEDFKKDYDHYQKLARGQSPTALWIGCSDSRVNPERVAGAKMGEIFVHRNIGNIAPENDLNFATVLEYAVKHLKVQDIVVYGHSDCGAMKALDKGAQGDEYVPQWLKNAEGVVDKANAVIRSPSTPGQEKERMRLIEYENIKLQMEHLRSYNLVKEAEIEGRIALHGLYYDLETGELKKIA